MTDGGLTRRAWLGASTLAATALGARAETPVPKTSGIVKYSFNTSTIRGQKVGLAREVEIAAEAGYNAIEPWMGTINDFVKGGGSLKDLGKKWFAFSEMELKFTNIMEKLGKLL